MSRLVVKQLRNCNLRNCTVSFGSAWDGLLKASLLRCMSSGMESCVQCSFLVHRLRRQITFRLPLSSTRVYWDLTGRGLACQESVIEILEPSKMDRSSCRFAFRAISLLSNSTSATVPFLVIFCPPQREKSSRVKPCELTADPPKARSSLEVKGKAQIRDILWHVP